MLNTLKRWLRSVRIYAAGAEMRLLRNAVVRRFFGDEDIVRMAFLEAGVADADKLRILLQRRNIRRAAVAHAGTQTADQLINRFGERAFVRELDGGCSSPVTAYARVNGEQLILRGFCDTYDGSFAYESASGSRHQAEQTGIGLARYMRDGL